MKAAADMIVSRITTMMLMTVRFVQQEIPTHFSRMRMSPETASTMARHLDSDQTGVQIWITSFQRMKYMTTEVVCSLGSMV